MFSLFWPSSFAVWKADKVKPTGTRTKGKIRVARENRSFIAVKIVIIFSSSTFYWDPIED